MKMLDIVVQEAITTTLTPATRDKVLGELLDLLVSSGSVNQDLRDDFLKAIIKRENRGSTGFGHGVAVPHIKHEKIDSMSLAIGVCKDGVDFNALDGQPVYCVFLLLSPDERPSEHLEAMEAVFGNLSQDTFRNFLVQATSSKDVITLLNEADANKIKN
jgi:mannitol/fructose-specific phosphotransferase system IIA component (Ntr-type)